MGLSHYRPLFPQGPLAWRGRITQVPASVKSASSAVAEANQEPAATKTAVPAHRMDDSASATVATRDETWRRRKVLRFAWARNQI